LLPVSEQELSVELQKGLPELVDILVMLIYRTNSTIKYRLLNSEKWIEIYHRYISTNLNIFTERRMQIIF